MTGNRYIFFGIDLAKPGSDISVEAECERLPDGTFALKSFRTWKHDLELEANKPGTDNDPHG